MITKEYLELYKKYPSKDNQYPGWEKDLEAIKEFNKELLKKYPWLTPTNDWSGKKITDCTGDDGEEGFWPGNPDKHPDYDYEYTWLDDMSEGWRIAFGDQMVEEIHQELLKYNYIDKYQIVQIKEKFGGLRWYDNGTPIGTLSKNYEEISMRGAQWPHYDRETEVCEEVSREHYISYFDKEARGNMTNEELEKYNLDAIICYRIYKIIDKCKIPDIIDKYEALSFKTCINCGKPAEYYTKGWINYICGECKNKTIKDHGDRWSEEDFIKVKE